MGFEPTNDGFANRSVKPLRHRVLLLQFFYSIISLIKTLEIISKSWYSMPYIHAPIAQLVEHRTLNPQVVGSIPIGRTRQKIPSAWDFLLLVRDGVMFFQQKKQTSRGPKEI